jgi:glutamate/tyrosine decarboxylase-like PLP-dependent enzyme
VFEGGAEWNPSDFAVHLSRRARGLPFWFSLAAHGTAAYAAAIEAALASARAAADEIRRRPELELALEPELSVVVFHRRGWDAADYRRWSDALIASGAGFVVPTSFAGRPAVRMAFVNPRTSLADVTGILDTMA